MSNYITVDGGTTNTRISLVRNGKIIGRVVKEVGARKSIAGNVVLKSVIKEGIRQLLQENHIKTDEIDKILASGMVTSEYGLMEIPHIVAPASIDEFHAAMVEVHFPDITEVPFVFGPGIRTDSRCFETADVMRGEETELFGLTDKLESHKAYILPGSHSKCIFADDRGRISHFFTSFTGEMFFALMKDTILKSAVACENQVDADYLVKGYEYSERYGLNRSLFKARILKNVFQCGPLETYSFFSGTVLHDEVKSLLDIDVEEYVIAGKSQLRNPMEILLKKYSDKKVTALPDRLSDRAATVGIIRIYEYGDRQINRKKQEVYKEVI